MDSKEYKELMKSDILLKTIKECQDKRFLQPFDISKIMRVKYVTAPLPMLPFRSKVHPPASKLH